MNLSIAKAVVCVSIKVTASGHLDCMTFVLKWWFFKRHNGGQTKLVYIDRKLQVAPKWTEIAEECGVPCSTPPTRLENVNIMETSHQHRNAPRPQASLPRRRQGCRNANKIRVLVQFSKTTERNVPKRLGGEDLHFIDGWLQGCKHRYDIRV